MYFFDCGEKEITAVAGYKYDCFSEIYDDTAFAFKKFAERKINLKIDEITVEYFENKVSQISDMGYARIGMHNLSRRLKLDYRDNSTFAVSQILVPECKLTYEAASEKAKGLMASGDFTEEIKRIYSDKHPKEFYEHPVHYKISADEVESAFEEAKLLVQSLYSNGRLKSRRVDRINKITDTCYDIEDMTKLFYNAEGGTVLIELSPYNDSGNSYASAYEQVIEFFRH